VCNLFRRAEASHRAITDHLLDSLVAEARRTVRFRRAA
jgi:hypothetical protein